MIIVLLLSALLLSVYLVRLLMRYAISRDVLAIPNERSSHTLATPSGGGAAIVIGFLISLVLMHFIAPLDSNVLFAIIGSGLFVAVVGFFDDHSHLPMKLRLAVHFISAFWVLYWLDIYDSAAFSDFNFFLKWSVLLIISVALVWLLNLYNFMDGIDGIAASEAIFISVVLGFFSYIQGQLGLSLMAFSLVVATTGFLFFNWPPAKIFMGDVGSGFLGITLGGITLILVIVTQVALPYFILFGVFIVDSTLTLAARFIRGERWYTAHCSHAYQYAARRWGHLRVTVAVNLINIFWLFPFSYIAYIYPDISVVLAIVALMPLVFITLTLGAGRRPELGE